MGTGFDHIRSSSGPPRRQNLELFIFHCIVRSQMLTSFCKRGVKYIGLYALNLCEGFHIKLEPIWNGNILKSHFTQFFLKREMFQGKKNVQKIKTYILYSITFFSKTVQFMR